MAPDDTPTQDRPRWKTASYVMLFAAILGGVLAPLVLILAPVESGRQSLHDAMHEQLDLYWPSESKFLQEAYIENLFTHDPNLRSGTLAGTRLHADRMNQHHARRFVAWLGSSYYDPSHDILIDVICSRANEYLKLSLVNRIGYADDLNRDYLDRLAECLSRVDQEYRDIISKDNKVDHVEAVLRIQKVARSRWMGQNDK